jgi:hypothetical protein
MRTGQPLGGDGFAVELERMLESLPLPAKREGERWRGPPERVGKKVEPAPNSPESPLKWQGR